MEVSNMVWRTCFGIHTNNDPKEPAQLRHDSIVRRGGRVSASLARRERFLIELATGGDQSQRLFADSKALNTTTPTHSL